MWCDRHALLGLGVAVSTDPALARALAHLASDDWPASNYLLIVRCPAVFRQVQSVDPCLSPQHLCADCAERWRSPAAGSGSDGVADAGGSQVQRLVSPASSTTNCNSSRTA
jgi:hypothetical protein